MAISVRRSSESGAAPAPSRAAGGEPPIAPPLRQAPPRHHPLGSVAYALLAAVVVFVVLVALGLITF